MLHSVWGTLVNTARHTASTKKGWAKSCRTWVHAVRSTVQAECSHGRLWDLQAKERETTACGGRRDEEEGGKTLAPGRFSIAVKDCRITDSSSAICRMQHTD